MVIVVTRWSYIHTKCQHQLFVAGRYSGELLLCCVTALVGV